VKDEFLDVIGQSFAFCENVPCAVEEDVIHPSMVGNIEGEILPVHGLEVTKDAIDDPQGRLQIQASLVMSSHDRMPVRDGLEDCLVGLMTDALSLDRKVEEGLGAEVRFVPQLGDHHGSSGRTIEALEDRVVESFQWSGPDAGIPNDLGDKPHDGHDDIRVHRHLEHPGDAVRAQDVTIPIGLLVEQWGWLVGRVGHRELDVLQVGSIECPEPSKTVGNARLGS